MRSSIVLTGLAVAALAAGSSTAVSAGGGGGHHYDDERVCVVLPASDEVFSSLSAADDLRRGLHRAEHRFGIEGVTLQPAVNDDIPAVLDEFLQTGDCDMIVGDFFVAAEMESRLADNPDQRFVGIDWWFAGAPSNARGVLFAPDQPSFMAGYAAAALTATGKVGVYGGMQIDPVTIFMDGFALGVDYYNDQMGSSVELVGWDIETATGLFAGNFDDVALGRALTDQLYDDGADIVFAVSGPLQLGSLEAAQDRAAAGEDVKVIGVDIDLFEAVGGDPSRVILTSATKEFDVALFHQIKDLVKGRWEPGVTFEDLNTRGVDLAPWHRTRRDVPRWLRQDIREIERAIERGEIITSVDRPVGPGIGEWFTNPANGHSYALIETVDFQNAENQAVGVGGHVVTIDDDAEQTWLYDTFGVSPYLIGLNDLAAEGTFEWVSGDPVTYTNWCPGEPNDHDPGEDVVHMGFDVNTCWNDVPNWGGDIAIVEVDPGTCDDPVGCVEFGIDEAVTIASALPLSGPLAELGAEELRAIELALEQRAELLNHPLGVIAEDTECSAAGGANAATAIVAGVPVAGVVGTACSAAATTGAPVISAAGLTMVSPANTSPVLTDPLERVDGYFRVAYNDVVQAERFAEYALNDLGATTAVVIAGDEPYARGVGSGFVDEFASLGGTPVIQLFDLATFDAASEINAVLAGGVPDVLFMLASENIMSELLTAARAASALDSTAIGTSHRLAGNYIAMAGPAAEGVYATVVRPPSGAAYDSFVAAYEARYGFAPDGNGAYAYDATNVLIDAIERGGEVLGPIARVGLQSVRDEMAATSGVDGASGTMTCDAFGDCATNTIVDIYQVQGGALVFLD